MAALLWFTLVSQYPSLMVSRALTGLFQQIINIYFPVWTDAFVSEKKKSSWLSIIMVGATIGNIIGYIMGAALQDSIGWRGAFYIQSGIIVCVIITYFTIPSQYINLRETHPRILEHQQVVSEEPMPLL